MKKLPMLSADLRQLVKRLGDEGAQLFATDVITEMGKRVPVDTGRMSKAGMAFVGNKLVAQTGDQIQIPPRMWKRKNTISFIFRTTKKTKGQVAFIDEHGLPVFDYSIMVLTRIMFFERMLHPSRLRGFIDSSLHKVFRAWLRNSSVTISS